ncbi:16S rRNA (uracil(1498)-N(3))-methyltransferase [Allohahella marinimesophila]|uniref:Ribosomal RNA small subunit methyltransferase E n=1 Tax=Allohahella marinimesophila TaxID=1054972 RepID=A0ABP7Q0B9_9GAMM
MRTSRIYIDPAEHGGLAATMAQPDRQLQLSGQSAHYLATVLRLREGDGIVLFDGLGSEFEAIIGTGSKRSLSVQLQNELPGLPPSPCRVTLVQGVSKGDRMDFAVQKATELGVHRIVPLLTSRCDVKLDDERKAKRLRHWQQIAISAAEQCGRSDVPAILPFVQLHPWLEEGHQGYILHPADVAASSLDPAAFGLVNPCLLVGPEGGFSDDEVNDALRAGYHAWVLGPRVLRTETAPLAALTVLQWQSGDLRGSSNA